MTTSTTQLSMASLEQRQQQQEEEKEESPSQNIYIPEEWARASDHLAYDSTTSPPPVVFICGAKNCGKTTFSRHLLNVFLNRFREVAYLDTDVGQPEFTPPGFLSLTVVDKLTPDLTIPCLKTPDRCYYYGDVSSRRDPPCYLKYIFALFDYYRKDLVKRELPLVVNTPGWVKGVGYDALVDMLRYIAPTYVVKINISAQNKNLPPGAFWFDEEHPDETFLIEIQSALRDSFNRSVLVQNDARLLRDLRIMAYFRQCFPSSQEITTIKELAQALTSLPPFEVPISSVKIKHLHCQVPSSEIFYSLNATIVGLAISSKESEDLPECVGLGVVRAIDTIKGNLYVITPVQPSILEKVDLLLQGFISIPSCLLQFHGCISPYMSANVLRTS